MNIMTFAFMKDNNGIVCSCWGEDPWEILYDHYGRGSQYYDSSIRVVADYDDETLVKEGFEEVMRVMPAYPTDDLICKLNL